MPERPESVPPHPSSFARVLSPNFAPAYVGAMGRNRPNARPTTTRHTMIRAKLSRTKNGVKPPIKYRANATNNVCLNPMRPMMAWQKMFVGMEATMTKLVSIDTWSTLYCGNASDKPGSAARRPFETLWRKNSEAAPTMRRMPLPRRVTSS